MNRLASTKILLAGASEIGEKRRERGRERREERERRERERRAGWEAVSENSCWRSISWLLLHLPFSEMSTWLALTASQGSTGPQEMSWAVERGTGWRHCLVARCWLPKKEAGGKIAVSLSVGSGQPTFSPVRWVDWLRRTGVNNGPQPRSPRERVYKGVWRLLTSPACQCVL